MKRRRTGVRWWESVEEWEKTLFRLLRKLQKISRDGGKGNGKDNKQKSCDGEGK